MAADSRSPFEFSTATQIEIDRRQGGYCALCGKLVKAGDTAYHHVITAQEAQRDAANAAFYRSATNGVLLHNGLTGDADSHDCHTTAHNGRYASFVASPKEYPASHKGTSQPKENHLKWRTEMDARIKKIPGPFKISKKP